MGTPLDVVTGGAGFIGSHLVEALLAAGRRVRVVDDLSTGRRERVPAGAEFLPADVNDAAGAAVRGAEVVYHLAALPSVPRSVERPLESHRATAQGTMAILEASARAGVRRVVFAGSSSVYGDTATLPKREDMPPRPLSPYAAAKLAGEMYARAFAALGRVEAVCLRFFNVYGPRQDPDSPYAAVIPVFLRRAREGRPFPIYGDGLQTRDFTFVGDVVEGILAAGRAPGVSGRVYNIAAGRPVSVRDLARVLAAILGVPDAVEARPPRPGDIRDSWADVSAARRDLGFAPRVPLEEGLRRTAQALEP
ncbi:MAG TPA: NAD-dependent epimerase/dehydratase family protein [Planctomycetota bacterium]|nr:NAD-dependent epimerase/dehydratase family protein [Planctomycetota bacterium]